MITPVLDWVIAEKISKDSAVVSEVDIERTHQKFVVLSVGPGVYEFGEFIKPSCKAGDTVIIEAHAAEGNTPPEMSINNLYVFKAARVIAVEVN